MIVVADLKAALQAEFQAARDRMEDAFFRNDIPVLGRSWKRRADEALSRVEGAYREVVEALDTIATAQATAVEVIAALDGFDGLILTPTASGGIDFDLTVLVGAPGDTPLELVLPEGDLDLGVLTDMIELDAQLELLAEISARTHFSISADGVVALLLDDDDEFTLSLDGTLGVPDGAAATLGFLEAKLGGAGDAEGISLDFGVDVISSTEVEASLSGSALLDRRVSADVGTAALPSIAANLTAGFNFDGSASTDGTGAYAASAVIGLEDITLDLGTFAEFLDKTLGEISSLANSFPIGKIVDILTQPLPVIDSIGPKKGKISLDDDDDGFITARDLIAIFSKGGSGDDDENGMAFVDAAIGLADALKLIDQLFDASDVNLGDLSLGAEATGEFGEKLDTNAPGIETNLEADLIAELSTGGFGDALDALLNPVGTPRALQIPLLDDPLQVVGSLLLNGLYSEPVTLLEYDLPKLSFNVKPYVPFNVGPIAFSIGGKFSGDVDFGVGYDTEGFNTDGINFNQGFYISADGETRTTADGEEYIPFGTLGVGMELAGGVSAGLVKVSAVGGFGGELDFALNSENNQTRLDDLLPCLFDPVTGRLVAGLEIEVKIGLGKLSVTERIKLAEVVLAQFDFDLCDRTFSPDLQFEDTNLAEFRVVRKLGLNIGSDAFKRDLPDDIDVAPDWVNWDGVPASLIPPFLADVKAEDEVFHVSRHADGLAVSAFGIFEVYDDSKVDSIQGLGGSGKDELSVDPWFDLPVFFNGDSGEDVLIGGAARDTLNGGSQNNTLIGGEGNDVLIGGSHDDYLVPGPGADSIQAVGGIDEVDYSGSKEAIELLSDPSSPFGTRWLGTGGEAEGDTLNGVEAVRGTDFDDVVEIRASGGAILMGGAGDDSLTADIDDDLFEGGAGADTLNGGDGNDRASYAFSPAAVTVDLAAGLIAGGDATGDVLTSIESFFLTAYGDRFTGDAEENEVIGFTGNDWILTGEGKDTVLAGGGNDTVYGGADGDLLDGGGAIQLGSPVIVTLDRDVLRYDHLAGPMSINLEAGLAGRPGAALQDTLEPAQEIDESGISRDIRGDNSFEDVIATNLNDLVVGDDDANHLQGLRGRDTLQGGGGDDTLVGGGGADSLVGGDGLDWADYSESAAAVEINLLSGTGTGGTASGDTLKEIEAVVGSPQADELLGDAEDNILDPGAFSGLQETIKGRAGVDVLRLRWEQSTTGLIIDGDGAKNDTVEDEDGTLLIESTAIERWDVATGTGNDRFGAPVLSNPLAGSPIFNNDDIVNTGAGEDTISTGGGRDQVLAGSGDDFVRRLIGTEAETFLLDGGTGVDRLILDVSYATTPVVLEAFGATDGADTNFLPIEGGGAIRSFEWLDYLFTGSGDDQLTQLGNVENFFSTGPGADTVQVDYGRNVVDADESDGPDGPDIDTLILDFRLEQDDRLVMARPFGAVPDSTLTTMLGSAPESTFTDFESVQVIGTRRNDVLLAVNPNEDIKVGSLLDGNDGNDTIQGQKGNDTLKGGLGSDVVEGKAGADEITGGQFGDGREADTLTGGLGRDSFVLGGSEGSHYGRDSRGRDDFATITDFDKSKDTLILAGAKSDYRKSQSSGNTEITLRETGETVAVLGGVTGVKLGKSYIQYVAIETGEGEALGSGGSAETVSLSTGPFTVTQGGVTAKATDVLVAAMAKSSLGISNIDVSIEGQAPAAGTFVGAPFGTDATLASGIVLSTGQVEDLVGRNTEDGVGFIGAVDGTDETVQFTELGPVKGGNATVFQADLTDFPGGLSRVTLADGFNLEGATGSASGFDVDAVILTREKLPIRNGKVQWDQAEPLDVFDYSPAGTTLTPGTQRDSQAEPLLGTVGGMVNEATANLGDADFVAGSDGGAVALGDGGVIDFALRETVDTSEPLYLYVAEAFSAGEILGGNIGISQGDTDAPADLSTDFGVPGVAEDSTTLTATFTATTDTGPEFVDLFHVVVVTEEFPEFGGRADQDLFDITINGYSGTVLSDGRAASMQVLAGAPGFASTTDLQFNPTDGGVLSDALTADAYTTALRVSGPILEGLNEVVMTVADGGDGLRDTAIFVAPITTARITGGGGNNRLEGSDADDTIIGRKGSDTAEGGIGWDTYEFTKAHVKQDVVVEGPGDGHDAIRLTGAGKTFLVRQGDDLEIRLGSAGASKRIIIQDQFAGDVVAVEDFNGLDLTGGLSLSGTGASDTGENAVRGTDFDDVLTARNGRDDLIGGAGDDTMSGGAGRDTYFFDPGSGADVIRDFNSNQDKIDLSALGLTDFATDIEPYLVDLTGAVLVDLTGGTRMNTITLELTNLAEVTGDLFSF